jgi:hypothetical protein
VKLPAGPLRTQLFARRFSRQVAQRIKDGELSEAEGSDLVNFYESRYDAYTYCS